MEVDSTAVIADTFDLIPNSSEACVCHVMWRVRDRVGVVFATMFIVSPAVVPPQGFGCAAIVETASAQAQKRKPNISVIMTDDVGWGDLGS